MSHKYLKTNNSQIIADEMYVLIQTAANTNVSANIKDYWSSLNILQPS